VRRDVTNEKALTGAWTPISPSYLDPTFTERALLDCDICWGAKAAAEATTADRSVSFIIMVILEGQVEMNIVRIIFLKKAFNKIDTVLEGRLQQDTVLEGRLQQDTIFNIHTRTQGRYPEAGCIDFVSRRARSCAWQEPVWCSCSMDTRHNPDLTLYFVC
jgi:hypothetical protein